MKDAVDLPEDYSDWLNNLRKRIRSAQQCAVRSVNRELVSLYWQIGHDILERQQRQGWGTRVIDRLSDDLRRAFPDMKGFSPRNLKYMRAFAEAWPDRQIVQEALAQLPWYHQITLLNKLKTREEREWYAVRSIEHGWSRNVLVVQIETRLRERQGRAVTNFGDRLPFPQSDLVQESLKDPYLFDFLGLAESSRERSVEQSLIRHITHFLLELGSGFAFIGRQSVPHRGRKGRVLHRSSFLSPQTSLLCRGGTQGRAVQARVRWTAQLLSFGNGCPVEIG